MARNGATSLFRWNLLRIHFFAEIQISALGVNPYTKPMILIKKMSNDAAVKIGPEVPSLPLVLTSLNNDLSSAWAGMPIKQVKTINTRNHVKQPRPSEESPPRGLGGSCCSPAFKWAWAVSLLGNESAKANCNLFIRFHREVSAWLNPFSWPLILRSAFWRCKDRISAWILAS